MLLHCDQTLALVVVSGAMRRVSEQLLISYTKVGSDYSSTALFWPRSRNLSLAKEVKMSITFRV